MRRLFLILLLLVPLGCQPIMSGSGTVVTQQLAHQGFLKVDVSSAFEIDIGPGAAHEVTVDMDDNLLPHLRTEVKGDTLKIGMQSGRSYRPSKNGRRVRIRMPELHELELSGACTATLAAFPGAAELELEASGASEIKGVVTATKLEIDLSGASEVTLSGSANKVDIDASGACEIDLVKLVAKDVSLDLSGASDVRLNISGQLDVEASGASSVVYTGEPKMGKIEMSGASSVKRLVTN